MKKNIVDTVLSTTSEKLNLPNGGWEFVGQELISAAVSTGKLGFATADFIEGISKDIIPLLVVQGPALILVGGPIGSVIAILIAVRQLRKAITTITSYYEALQEFGTDITSIRNRWGTGLSAMNDDDYRDRLLNSAVRISLYTASERERASSGICAAMNETKSMVFDDPIKQEGYELAIYAKGIKSREESLAVIIPVLKSGTGKVSGLSGFADASSSQVVESIADVVARLDGHADDIEKKTIGLTQWIEQANEMVWEIAGLLEESRIGTEIANIYYIAQQELESAISTLGELRVQVTAYSKRLQGV